jgi:ribosomal protein S18 acetylase RimI-like enzyme
VVSGVGTFVRLPDEVDPERHIADVLTWAYEAAWPPLHWLVGDEQTARDTLARWMARDSSEASIRRVTMLLDDERSAGGYFALTGSELQQCRYADMLALIADAGRPGRRGLMRRLRTVAELQVEVRPDEYYLSRLGVKAELRGMGRGRALLEDYFASGRRAGFARFRLDVRPENVSAVSLYESAGFRIVAERSAGGMGSLVMAIGP